MLNEAVTAYKKAIQIKTDYQQAHNNLGKVYFTLGRYDDALTEYNNALKIDPDFHFNLGYTYLQKDELDNALKEFETTDSADYTEKRYQ